MEYLYKGKVWKEKDLMRWSKLLHFLWMDKDVQPFKDGEKEGSLEILFYVLCPDSKFYIHLCLQSIDHSKETFCKRAHQCFQNCNCIYFKHILCSHRTSTGSKKGLNFFGLFQRITALQDSKTWDLEVLFAILLNLGIKLRAPEENVQIR